MVLHNPKLLKVLEQILLMLLQCEKCKLIFSLTLKLMFDTDTEDGWGRWAFNSMHPLSMLSNYSSSVLCQHIIYSDALNASVYVYSCLLWSVEWIGLELNKAFFLTTLIKSITSTLKSNCCWSVPLIFVKPCLATGNSYSILDVPTGSPQLKKQSR